MKRGKGIAKRLVALGLCLGMMGAYMSEAAYAAAPAANAPGTYMYVAREEEPILFFEETYSAQLRKSIQICKTLDGRAFRNGDTFSFAVTAQDGGPLPEADGEYGGGITVEQTGDTVSTVTIACNAGAVAGVTDAWTFDVPICFTQEGTYTYAVTEIASGAPGLAYDETVYTVQFVVSDGDGELQLETVTVTKNDGTPQEYAPDQTLSLAFAGRAPVTRQTAPGQSVPVRVGQQITYEIDWVNFAQSGADVTVNDLLDIGVDFVSAAYGQGDDRVELTAGGTVEDGSIRYDSRKGLVTWTFAGRDHGDHGTVELTVRVNENAFLDWVYYTTLNELDGGVFTTNGDEKIVNRAGVTAKAGTTAGEGGYMGPSTYLTDILENPLSSDGGSLTVTGQTGEDDDDKPFSFTVKILDSSFQVDTGFEGTYGGMSFENGVAHISMGHGESVTAAGLPLGIRYEVTEDESSREGYVTTATGDRGMIVGGGNAAAFVDRVEETAFVDRVEETAEEVTGGLLVYKMVAGTGADEDKEFDYTVVLYKDRSAQAQNRPADINGVYGRVENAPYQSQTPEQDIVFDNGVAHFTLRHRDTAVIQGLPPDIVYLVVEDPDGYSMDKVRESGSIPANGNAAAVFINSVKQS